MTSKHMYELRQSGYTYQSIADMCQMSKQNVYERVMAYRKKAEKGIRGQGFDINKIVFKGIYEHFKNNPCESIYSFCCKISETSGRAMQTKIKAMITGQHKSFFNINQIQRICDVCKMTFEETFAER